MDVGKKCLLIAILGMILALVSSPFVINMAFTGRPFVTFISKKVLIEVPPDEYGPISRTITHMEKIMGPVTLNSSKGEEYKVSLNIVTNDTVNVLIFCLNSSDIIQKSFNAGNYTDDIRITGVGSYVLNATNTGNSAVKATFKITESWRYETTEWEEQIDLLKTVVAPIWFALGIVMLVYSLIKLRREAKKTYPEAAEEAAVTGYVEVDDE